jgi:hypothetical protein
MLFSLWSACLNAQNPKSTCLFRHWGFAISRSWLVSEREMSAFRSLVVKITRLVPTDEGQVTTQKRTYFR